MPERSCKVPPLSEKLCIGNNVEYVYRVWYCLRFRHPLGVSWMYFLQIRGPYCKKVCEVCLDLSGIFIFLKGHKALPERALTGGLLLVSLLEVEAAPEREFKAILISQKFLFLDR